MPIKSLLDQHRSSDIDLTRRLPKGRMLYPVAALSWQPMRSYVRQLREAGAEIRFSDDVPYRMVMADGSKAIMPVDTKDLGYGALLITDEGVVEGLVVMVEALFASASANDAADDLGEAPSTVDRRVLAMMSSGVTDKVAAGHLSVSERTYRRQVSAVMARLGATSRFQAGVHAVERGWL